MIGKLIVPVSLFQFAMEVMEVQYAVMLYSVGTSMGHYMGGHKTM